MKQTKTFDAMTAELEDSFQSLKNMLKTAYDEGWPVETENLMIAWDYQVILGFEKLKLSKELYKLSKKTNKSIYLKGWTKYLTLLRTYQATI